MDRLLVVTPTEVRLHFETGKQATAKIRLHNVMHTMPVAFKVWSTAPKKYTVLPQCFIIPPLGEHVIQITANCNFPDKFPYSQDRFYVKSLTIPTGKATHAELNLWFTTRKKHVFNDGTLSVVFTGRHVLLRLAANGSFTCVNEVLRDTHVDARDNNGRTALFLAAVQGNLDAVKALIGSKADVNSKDKSGQTPLFEAVLAGHVKIVEALLAAKADTWHRNWRGWTCLHAATAWHRNDIVRLLLNSGADMNAVDERGGTPLHEAVLKRNFQALVMLVQEGADLDKPSRDGSTALHVAAAVGCAEMVNFLLQEGANMNVQNAEGKTPHQLACEYGHSHLLGSMLLQETLQKAACRNDVSLTNECLLLGAAPDETDQHGWTALHRASFKGHIEVVKLLLKHQVDINLKDEKGYSPLHCAVEAGHAEVVELLLQHGADICSRTCKGALSPLGLASKAKHLPCFPLKLPNNSETDDIDKPY